MDKHKFIPQSGGGATHIATSLVGTGVLSEYESNKSQVIIVAGGGGGLSYDILNGHKNSWSVLWEYSGAGGGLTGGEISGRPRRYLPESASWDYFYNTDGSVTVNNIYSNRLSATQERGGEKIDEASSPGKFGRGQSYEESTSGASYAGGGGGWYGGGSRWGVCGGGGSGYLNTSMLTNAATFTGDGTDGTFDAPLGGTEIGQTGDGYARIRTNFEWPL